MAVADHAKYPQYTNYFSGWVLASATRTVKYKGGSQLYRGRWVLSSPDLTSWYDPDCGYVCGVQPGDLTRLA